MISPLIRLPMRPKICPAAAKSTPTSMSTSGLMCFGARTPDEHGNDQEDGPKESHATLPRGEDMLGMHKIIATQSPAAV